ncbi:phenylacetate--CoA ligase family protein [Candidatus Wolfebacteria bacterium]|nr:phenylacetate--CoA ligase family protein [Candidatus Wolfebacteria bacterium]
MDVISGKDLNNKKANLILNAIRTKKENFWLQAKEKNALGLFHLASRRVPAYKDFLRKNKVQPEKIKTFQDFQFVPLTNKKEYLQKYPLASLTWDGSLNKPLVYCSTSGSTGEPFYFPRNHQLDWESSVIHQLFLENGFRGHNGPTLIIIAFGMGVWIGGLITYKAFEIAGQRGNHSISILTTGINKKEIFSALQQLVPHYHQVILVGYAPFIKDIIDEAPEYGVNTKKLNLRLLFAAEIVPEKLREYFTQKTGLNNMFLDTLNVYGTADIGTMAYETPVAILLRRLALKNKNLFQLFFSSNNKVPTLAQYDPHFITFEAPNGDILLTGNNSIPLIRYSIGDRGGVFSFGEAKKKLNESRISLLGEAKKVGISKHIYELPFVYVYERDDLATTLYGLIIYPGFLKSVLLGKPLNRFLSGKFTIITKFDRRNNQYLEINLELRRGKESSQRLKEVALRKIIAELRSKSSEFRELSDYLVKRAWPKLIFWPAEHPLHFKPGVKQKWVKK